MNIFYVLGRESVTNLNGIVFRTRIETNLFEWIFWGK